MAFRANVSESKNSNLVRRGPPQDVFRRHAHITNCLFKSGFKVLIHFSVSLLEIGDKRGNLQSWKVSTYSVCSCISLDLRCFDFCWLLFWVFLCIVNMEYALPRPVKGPLSR